MGKCERLHRLLDVPGVQELEDWLVLRPGIRGEPLTDFSFRCDEIAKARFGLTKWDVFDLFAASYLDRRPGAPLEDIERAFEATYTTVRLEWDRDIAEYLKALGWDFFNDYGQPAKVTEYFCWQAEAVALGLGGKMPDMTETNAELWGKALEQEAKARKNRADR